MKPRFAALVLLLLLFLCSLVWLLSLDWRVRLSTDVMDLIPDRSQSAELSLGRSVLKDVYANRIMIALRSVEDERAIQAYIATLTASPLVDRVVNLSAADSFADVGEFVYQHRFQLLFPQWLDSHFASDHTNVQFDVVVNDLETALNDPSFIAFEELVPSDPLLLMRDAATAFTSAQPTATIEADAYLLEVTLKVSALQASGQLPVFDLLNQAKMNAMVYVPSIHVLDTGAHRYAWETENAMRKEVRMLNFSTALVVFLICTLLCRRVFLVVHVAIILAISLMSSLALMMCFFDQVHVFALIFGSVLCGVIVDYGLHAYLHDAGHDRRRLRFFLKPFLISCGSTLMGFSILLFSELAVLRQMGLMVVCGIGMAVFVTLIYMFLLLRDSPTVPLRPREFRIVKSGKWIVLCVAALALAALPMVRWQDDISHLKYPLPHLDAVDAEIRNLHGGERVVLLTLGEDYSSSRASVAKLNQWLQQQGVSPRDTLSAAAWVPTFREYMTANAFIIDHPNFADEMVTHLAQAGYDAEAFVPFVQDWEAIGSKPYESLVNDFSKVLSGGLSGMVGCNEDLHWWVTLVNASIELEELPVDMNTLRLSQVESMSSVLSKYRQRTLELSLLGGIAMYAILLFTFGWKAATQIVCIPVVAVISSLVAIYLLFGALGIFHLIGLFLGACLVLDYSVFSWLGVVRTREIPFSVAVSACTTAASFGILCMSRIPAIHALGLAVFCVTAIGAVVTYLLIPNIAGKKSSDHAS